MCDKSNERKKKIELGGDSLKKKGRSWFRGKKGRRLVTKRQVVKLTQSVRKKKVLVAFKMEIYGKK